MNIKKVFKDLTENFCGKKIEIYKDEVVKRNFDKFMSFSLYGFVISTIMLFSVQLVQERLIYTPIFVIISLYFLILYLMLNVHKNHYKGIIASFYISLIPLMAIAIFKGTVMSPNEISITIIVFICLLPMFILDKPWRVVLFITLTSLAFIFCAYYNKQPVIFKRDMLDIIFFYLVSICTNLMSLKEKIDNVENYVNLRAKSEHDSLTMIYNRGTGERKINALTRAKQYGMFCIMDIDNFKAINDKHSHSTGDIVLKEVSEKIKVTFRSDDVIFRLGGDEFAVYAVGITKEEQGRACIDRLFQAIAEIDIPVLEKQKVSISLGATLFCFGDQRNFEKIYKDSDAALYRAKEAGKNRYFFVQD